MRRSRIVVDCERKWDRRNLGRWCKTLFGKREIEHCRRDRIVGATVVTLATLHTERAQHGGTLVRASDQAIAIIVPLEVWYRAIWIGIGVGPVVYNLPVTFTRHDLN